MMNIFFIKPSATGTRADSPHSIPTDMSASTATRSTCISDKHSTPSIRENPSSGNDSIAIRFDADCPVTRHGYGAEPHQHGHNYRIFSVAVSDAVRFFSRVGRNHQYLQSVTTETVRYRVDFSRGLRAQLNRLMRIDNHGNRPMYPWRGLVYAWINACNFSGSLYVIGAVCSYAIMIGCDGKTPSVPHTSTDRPFSTDDPLSGVPVSIDVSNNNRPPTNIEKLAVLSDPALDAWDTEVLYQRVTKQLAALRTLIEHPEEITRARVSPLITENFTCDPFLPIDLREVFNGPTMVVRRAQHWTGLDGMPTYNQAHRGSSRLSKTWLQDSAQRVAFARHSRSFASKNQGSPLSHKSSLRRVAATPITTFNSTPLGMSTGHSPTNRCYKRSM